MAIVGHFNDLAEALKLVQSKLLAGVVQETYEEGQLVSRLPVMVIDSLDLTYNREASNPGANFFDIHEQIPWTADVTYATPRVVALKRVIRQDILDKFIMDTYKDPNDYKSIILSQLRKGVMRTVEDNFIYGDTGADAKTPDGLHRLLDTDIAGGDAFTTATNLQAYDMGGASAPVSLTILRQLIDQVKPRPTFLLMTRTMRNTLSAVAFEKGIVLSNAQPLGGISFTPDEFGRRVDFFDGVPIIVSDYLLQEDDNTGGKDTGNNSGIVSIYAVRTGSIADGGLTLTIGGQTGAPEMFNVIEKKDLENYDADGMRLVAYYALALGSSKGLARIHSIDENGEVTT